mmetsp:Transcript_13704/g.36706  ORF Transcript_13704/g.36706 Transcript_13704/m.36706 type:complete len:869 (-) Transcript_13704:372-2978(-)
MVVASPTKSSPISRPSERASAQSAVWDELFGTVSSLDDTIETALQAYAPPDAGDKVVSATTKRRLLIKSLAQLKQGKQGIQLLTEHLRALQAASQQWQRTMMYASKSHEELMEQLENTNRDLHLTSERLRKVEAQRLAAVREAEGMRVQMQQMEVERKAQLAAAKQREEELETAQFTYAEAQSELARLRQSADEAKVAAAEAEQARDRAVASLDGVKAEAAKASSNAERHQETVAKLTADNLVFLMNLKKAEAELAAANQEKLQLRQAAEKQRGPWFDEVRASVEERVRQAMTRAEALELELESTRQHHHCELQDILGQKADLEEFLAQMRQHEADLEAGLQAARSRQASAEEEALQATSAASQLRAKVEALEAEARVSQSNLRSMRQECTERWVSEQAALGQFNQLQARITSLEQAGAAQQEAALQLQARLEGQLSINRQLMSKKEDVEWQLMDALAKLDGSSSQHHAAHAAPPHLSPRPSPSHPRSPPHPQSQQPYHHHHTDHHPEQRIVLAPPVIPSPPSSSTHHTPRGSPTKAAASSSISTTTTTTTTTQPPSLHSAPPPIPILLPATSAVESRPAAPARAHSQDESLTSAPLPVAASAFYSPPKPSPPSQLSRPSPVAAGRGKLASTQPTALGSNPSPAPSVAADGDTTAAAVQQGSNSMHTTPSLSTQPAPSYPMSSRNSLHVARGDTDAPSAAQSSPDLILFSPSSPAAPALGRRESSISVGDAGRAEVAHAEEASASVVPGQPHSGAEATGEPPSRSPAAPVAASALPQAVSPQHPAGGHNGLVHVNQEASAVGPVHAGLSQDPSATEQPRVTQHSSRVTATPSQRAGDHQDGEAAAHFHGSGLRRISAIAATTPPPKRS